MHRDKCSRQLAEAKVAAQMPLERKAALANHIIDNSGDRAALESQAGVPPKFAVMMSSGCNNETCRPCCDCPGACAGEQTETVFAPARAPDVPCHCGHTGVAYPCSVFEEVRALPAARPTDVQHRPLPAQHRTVTSRHTALVQHKPEVLFTPVTAALATCMQMPWQPRTRSHKQMLAHLTNAYTLDLALSGACDGARPSLSRSASAGRARGPAHRPKRQVSHTLQRHNIRGRHHITGRSQRWPRSPQTGPALP